MKKIASLILLVFFAVACKKNNNDSTKENKTIEVSKNSITTISKPKNDTSILCTINGVKWAYTKASGIIDTHARTKKRTAIITFKKKLQKGSESIQLYYDADTFKLIEAALQLKFKTKDGKLSTCFYKLNEDTKKRNPESELSGVIDLTNGSKASGTAEIKNLNIRFEKEKLQNAEDAKIQVTGLKFSEIGYSNLDKVFKSLEK